MTNNTRVAKAYLKDDNTNKVCFIYENKYKGLLIRTDGDLNENTEDVYLTEFISSIVKYETNGVEKYERITHSKDKTDSHNNG